MKSGIATWASPVIWMGNSGVFPHWTTKLKLFGAETLVVLSLIAPLSPQPVSKTNIITSRPDIAFISLAFFLVIFITLKSNGTRSFISVLVGGGSDRVEDTSI
jgi:hypothetical protein